MGFKGRKLKLFRGKGCDFCSYTGYNGRTVIGEIINIHSAHRRLISKKASSQEIDRVSRKLGYKNIKENGIELIKKGVTTTEELMGLLFK